MRWIIPTGCVLATVGALVLWPWPVALTLVFVFLFVLWFNWGRWMGRFDRWLDRQDYLAARARLDKTYAKTSRRMDETARRYRKGRPPRGW